MAVVAALVSFAASWLGAGIAATSASENVTKQLVGETEKSKNEFLREQRRVAYVRTMQDVVDHLDAIREFEDAAESGDESLKRKTFSRVDKTMRTMIGDRAMLMVASEDVDPAFLDVVSATAIYRNGIKDYVAGLDESGKCRSMECGPTYERRMGYSVEADKSVQALARAFRHDLSR